MPETVLGLRIHSVCTALAFKSLYASIRGGSYKLAIIGIEVKAANFVWGNHGRLPRGGDV